MGLPSTEAGFYAWMTCLIAVYIAVTCLVNLLRFKSIHHDDKEFIAHAFDAVTFATSIMVLVGLLFPNVLNLIGNTKLILFIGASAGVVYSLSTLFPRSKGSKP